MTRHHPLTSDKGTTTARAVAAAAAGAVVGGAGIVVGSGLRPCHPRRARSKRDPGERRRGAQLTAKRA